MEGNRFETLVVFLKALERKAGYKFTIKMFQDRLRLQKIVYIAKYFGIDLGYYFDLYIRGPYSSELADDYYAIENKFGGELPKVSEELVSKFAQNENLLKFAEMLKKYHMESYTLELIATLLIYMKNRSINPLTLSPEKEKYIIETIHEMKPYFSELAIKQALDIIKKEIPFD